MALYFQEGGRRFTPEALFDICVKANLFLTFFVGGGGRGKKTKNV